MGYITRSIRLVGLVGLGVAAAAWGTGAVADVHPTEAAVAADGGPPEDSGPSTQPAAEPTNRPAGVGGPRFGVGGSRMGLGRGGRLGGGQQTPTPADRADSLTFLKQHAPEQYRILEAMPDDSDQRRMLETVIARAYVNYQRIKTDDPDLYGVIVTRVEAEDGILKLSADLRQATDGDRPAAKQRLRDQVAKWFDLNLQERKLRLEKLKRTVRAAEDKLAADTTGRDQLINERVNHIAKSGNTAGSGDLWVPTGGGDR